MLKIHKLQSKSKLLLTLGITSICITSSLLALGLLSALTYTPELSHAETAIYPEKEARTMAGITYMQEITPDICQNSTLNQQYTLTDSRDGTEYTVAKIKNQTNDETDCWMTRNLRIINKKISSANSDMKSGNFTIPTSNKSGFTLSDTNTRKAYLDDTYGGYYNWYTATAGSGAASFENGDAPESICPKGWRLPTGGPSADGEFFRFLNGLTVTQIVTTPYNYERGGFVTDSSVSWISSKGFYWSSTVHNAYDAFNLDFYTNIASTPYNSRYNGYSVRCLARTESTPNNNVEITINNTISLDVASEVTIEKGESNPSTAALPVSVASNQPYSVSISSTNPNLISSTTSTTIPSRSGTLNTAVNGWGIKLSSNSTYSQITSTPTTFYTAAGAEVKTIPFTVGISTSPDLSNGEYSTDITITATQN